MDDWTYRPATDFGLTPRERLTSLRRESGLVSTLAHHVWWFGVRSYARIWHRLSIEGRPLLPKHPPFVMIANHASHLDTLVTAAAVPLAMRHCVFPIAAGDTFFETTMRRSFSALMLNALPMWRHNCGRHAIGTMRERLTTEPCIFVLFPEGTRSRDGSMGRFRAGVGMLVAGTDIPVVPCHIGGAFEALPPGGRVPRPRRITLHIGKPRRFEKEPNDRAGWDRIATELQDAVTLLDSRRVSEEKAQRGTKGTG